MSAILKLLEFSIDLRNDAGVHQPGPFVVEKAACRKCIETLIEKDVVN
ncbi:hypothetical protein NIASO_05775 [Niabella soli DSM 19437]|uniref:Uncharacterized protein n=1 Tax=Niabella soli DSM 19437 TaxID=929713 RepID=W0F794_9BACT|nr:hypothetical protein NIASO_05775 [Niabella soli DSM 19437]